MTNVSLFCVGKSPSCGTGRLGVRRCGKCGRPHVLCDECDGRWLTRDTTQPPTFSCQPDVPCVQCEQSLRDSSARWATWQELIELAWPSADGDAKRSDWHWGTPHSTPVAEVNSRGAVDGRQEEG
jgi:hypothetical protein